MKNFKLELNPKNILILLVTSFLFGTGCASVVHTVGVITGDKDMQKADLKMTPSRQYYVGRSFAATVLEKYPLIEDKAVMNYINKVGQYLALHVEPTEGGSSPFKGFHFGVFKSDAPMAMSSPGGFVLISSAMVQMLKNEDQLAAILGHEMGHIMWEHGVKEIETAAANAGMMKLGIQALTLAGGSDGQKAAQMLSFFGDTITDLVGKSFSKDDEYVADRYGYYLTRRAGYDSAQLLNVIQMVSNSPKGSGAGGISSRHPAGSDRITKVKSLQKRRPASSLNRKRVKRFAKFKSILAKATR